MMPTERPHIIIDGTTAWCGDHPTIKFHYRQFRRCRYCARTKFMSTPHTEKQKKMFFALASQLGYTAEQVKERAKKRYGLASFNDATSEQLNYLIDKLLEQQAQRGGEHKKNE